MLIKRQHNGAKKLQLVIFPFKFKGEKGKEREFEKKRKAPRLAHKY
jgi:hypothetical protein